MFGIPVQNIAFWFSIIALASFLTFLVCSLRREEERLIQLTSGENGFVGVDQNIQTDHNHMPSVREMDRQSVLVKKQEQEKEARAVCVGKHDHNKLIPTVLIRTDYGRSALRARHQDGRPIGPLFYRPSGWVMTGYKK